MEYIEYAINDEVKLLNENMALTHITINNVKETSDLKLLEIVCKINESFKSYKNFIDSDFVSLFKLSLEENSFHDKKVWTMDDDMKHYPEDQIKILNSIIQKFGLRIMTSTITGGYIKQPTKYQKCARVSIEFLAKDERQQIRVELDKVIIYNNKVDIMTPPIYETDIDINI